MCLHLNEASLVAQMVTNLPAMWETWVQSLGPEEGNGNALQFSCLENSMDRGARQATVYGCLKESDTTEQLTNITRGDSNQLPPQSLLLFS